MTVESYNSKFEIEDPAAARTFLFVYLSETWEKLLQIAAFVGAREHRRSRRKWAVITNFQDVLKYLTKQLDESGVAYYKYLTSGNPFVVDEFVRAVVGIKDVLSALLKLHARLNLLMGKGENQTAYDFVRKLVADTTVNLANNNSWLPFVPSIALTDDYNFIEYDLRNVLSSDLVSNRFDALSPQSRNVVLALPKAEVDNPLMWAILAHEIAHTMIDSYKIVENEVLARTPGYKKADEISRNVYRNWSTEICADLIALRLLGPSYFFSLASMGLLLDPPIVTADHPAMTLRVSTLESVLRKDYPYWIIDCPYADNVNVAQQGLIPFFSDLVRYKYDLWTEARYRRYFQPTGDSEAKTLQLQPNRDLIIEALERAHVPVTHLASSEEISRLFKVLSTGQPVSSQFADGFNYEAFHKKLHDVKNADELYSILPPPEEPLTLATILSCGWLFKVYNNYTYLSQEIVAKQSLLSLEESYSKAINSRNELLQNSLSRAFMMQMHRSWRGVSYESNDKQST